MFDTRAMYGMLSTTDPDISTPFLLPWHFCNLAILRWWHLKNKKQIV